MKQNMNMHMPMISYSPAISSLFQFFFLSVIVLMNTLEAQHRNHQPRDNGKSENMKRESESESERRKTRKEK
jgi:hypothetical protein